MLRRANAPATSPTAIGWLLASLLPIAASCAPTDDLRASPQTLVFAPARAQATLTLDNSSDAPRSIARVRLDPRTPDWGSFVIVDSTIAREVPARGRVEFHLRADLEHFVAEHAPGQPVRYRPGRAALLLEVDGQALEVPLRFVAPAAVDLVAVAGGAGLFALVGGLVLAAIRRGRALAAVPWLFLITLAMTPWGLGLCTGDLGARLGRGDLEQCGAGYGGVALAWLHPDAGLLLWIAALFAIDLADWAASLRGSAPASALRQTSRRLSLDLALALAAIAVPLIVGAVDLAAIAGGTTGELGEWGVVRAPVAAILVVAIQSLRRATIPAGIPEALDRITFALLGVTLFLGGGTLPGDPTHALPHVAAILVGAAVVLVKTAALVWLFRLVDRRRSAPGARRGSSPAALVLLVVAALVHLVAVALIRATAA